MKTYQIIFSRPTVETATEEIEAENETEARKKAAELIVDEESQENLDWDTDEEPNYSAARIDEVIELVDDEPEPESDDDIKI